MKRFLINRFLLVFIVLSFGTICFSYSKKIILAGVDQDKVTELEKQIKEIEQKIEDSKNQAVTLTNIINNMVNQIKLTEAQIEQTKEKLNILSKEIDDLVIKINQLELKLDDLSQLLLARVNETYKQGRTQTWQLLFSSRNISEFLYRMRYLEIVQARDKKMMVDVKTNQENYKDQKKLLEEKKKEQETLKNQLEAYNTQLVVQKRDQEYILDETKKNQVAFEAKLQELIAEREAINAITAGLGEEVYLRDVNEGDSIGSVISGISTCSPYGTHLHFQINDGQQNPANYLKNINFIDDRDIEDKEQRGLSFSGDWNWPLDEPIAITQEYGMTYFVSLYCYYGRDENGNCRPHNAIDMYSQSSLRVKAVKKGKLYQGTYAACGGILYYAKVEHEDGTKTYYLHMYAK